jgi:hypothetical protein
MAMTTPARAVTVEVDVFDVDARACAGTPERLVELIGARLEALIATRGLPERTVRARDGGPIGDDARALADHVAEQVWAQLVVHPEGSHR